jgi:hypothetical protein
MGNNLVFGLSNNCGYARCRLIDVPLNIGCACLAARSVYKQGFGPTRHACLPQDMDLPVEMMLSFFYLFLLRKEANDISKQTRSHCPAI